MKKRATLIVHTRIIPLKISLGFLIDLPVAEDTAFGKQGVKILTD